MCTAFAGPIHQAGQSCVFAGAATSYEAESKRPSQQYFLIIYSRVETTRRDEKKKKRKKDETATMNKCRPLRGISPLTREATWPLIWSSSILFGQLNCAEYTENNLSSFFLSRFAASIHFLSRLIELEFKEKRSLQWSTE